MFSHLIVSLLSNLNVRLSQSASKTIGCFVRRAAVGIKFYPYLAEQQIDII
ncbi:hypothetical protein ALTER154_100223 [Alteromonas sp. 154]|nr:hypothetical protein ALTER154_100223 [Alteromonas sp. 154]